MIKAFDDLIAEVQKAIKDKPIRNRKYLDSFRDRKCLYCNDRETVVGHHLKRGTQRGQRKASDCFVIPVCYAHHIEADMYETAQFKSKYKDVDIREFAWHLYNEWKKLNEKM